MCGSRHLRCLLQARPRLEDPSRPPHCRRIETRQVHRLTNVERGPAGSRRTLGGIAMRPNTSKIRTAAGIALIATATLACVGFMVAYLVGDQTPPYEPALANLAWSLFMICFAA